MSETPKTTRDGAQPSTTIDPTNGRGVQLDSPALHQFVGRAEVRRIGRWGFPVYELDSGGSRLAQMGRTGWVKVYLGRGQRIELADGDGWTLRAVGSRGAITPVIIDSSGRKVTTAGMAHGTYGLNGKDYACSLYPAHRPRAGRANRWILRHFEDELAMVTRHPLAVDAVRPVHLGAVLLAFHLVRYGLPEEASPVLASYSWAAR